MTRKNKTDDATTTAPSPGTEAAPAGRPKRKWSTYNQFVHDHYGDAHVQEAAVRDRLRIIGKMWQAHKKNMAEQ